MRWCGGSWGNFPKARRSRPQVIRSCWSSSSHRTRPVFDNARQSLKSEEIEGIGVLDWLNHGRFELKGVEEPVEICEVRSAEIGVLPAPTTSEKARRVEAAEGETVLGWRPAVGQVVPNTKWLLEKKLGEGGFGEVWLGQHQTMKERRVFKFCFRADRVRSLKREMTLFRLIKEWIGQRTFARCPSAGRPWPRRRPELAARERAAYRRGIARTAAVALLVVVVGWVPPMAGWVQTKLPRRSSCRTGSAAAREAARSTANSATQSLCPCGSTSICWTRHVRWSSDGVT